MVGGTYDGVQLGMVVGGATTVLGGTNTVVDGTKLIQVDSGGETGLAGVIGAHVGTWVLGRLGTAVIGTKVVTWIVL